VKRKTVGLKKTVIDPRRIRAIPSEGFSWIDRRFVREGFLEPLPREAILLYFFLVSVSDPRGLSFYADVTVRRILKLDAEELTQARAELIEADLIRYRYPIYQVLSLPEKPPARPSSHPASPTIPRGGEPMSLGEILRRCAGPARNPEPPRQERP
jgi:hypothetical protein